MIKKPQLPFSMLLLPFKGRVQCFSMQVVMNKCFFLNPKKKIWHRSVSSFSRKTQKRHQAEAILQVYSSLFICSFSFILDKNNRNLSILVPFLVICSFSKKSIQSKFHET